MRAGSPSPPPQKLDSEHWCCSPVERTQRSLSLYITVIHHNWGQDGALTGGQKHSAKRDNSGREKAPR